MEPMEQGERELAKCVGFDFGIEDHGLPYLHGHFDYDGSSSQGFGMMVDAAFLMRFMAVFGVDKLQAVNGEACWVTHTDGKILMIEPLFRSSKRPPFVIAEWSAWVQRRASFSAHELLTGEEPRK